MNSRIVRCALYTALAGAVAARAESALEIARKAQDRTRAASEHYEGTLSVIDSKNKITEKRWQYDRIGSHGASKVILRFTAPPEVKGVALLVLNHPDRSSDQWMWTPALERDRRVAMQDRSTRFFGTDFSFEDLEERDVAQFDYSILGEEPLDGAACWKLESRPKQSKTSQYTSSQVWVRKDNYVVLRIDNYKDSKVVRRIAYSDVQNVQNIWTPKKIEVTDFGRNSRTVLKVDNLRYNQPMKDEDFTLQALRRAS
jgi:outer membrane lipoprotein-sorting protein